MPLTRAIQNNGKCAIAYPACFTPHPPLLSSLSQVETATEVQPDPVRELARTRSDLGELRNSKVKEIPVINGGFTNDGERSAWLAGSL